MIALGFLDLKQQPDLPSQLLRGRYPGAHPRAPVARRRARTRAGQRAPNNLLRSERRALRAPSGASTACADGARALNRPAAPIRPPR